MGDLGRPGFLTVPSSAGRPPRLPDQVFQLRIMPLSHAQQFRAPSVVHRLARIRVGAQPTQLLVRLVELVEK